MHHKISMPSLIIALLLWFPCHIQAQDTNSPTEGIDQHWLKTLVSIEILQTNGNANAIGTGFLILTTNSHTILVTAKHVVLGDDGNLIKNLAYRFNRTDKQSALVPEDHMARYATNWFFSSNADVACRFIAFGDDFDITRLTTDIFLSQSRIKPAAPVLIPGFPMGIRSEEHANPIVRRGIVARSTDEDLILDAFVFPGNSGGPVFYFPTLKFSGDVIKIPFVNRERLIGLVSGSISYVDTAISQQTHRPRITFEENSGLCNIVSTDDILALIERNDVQRHDNHPQLTPGDTNQ